MTVWSLLHLPRFLLIADTPYKVPAWNWMVALMAKTASTRIKDKRMWYEPNEYQDFISLLKPQGVFMDLGCFMGYYSLLAASHGASYIIAVDAVKARARFTNQVLSLNKIPHRVFHSAFGVGYNVRFFEPCVVGDAMTKTLDTICQEVGCYPDTIKMDIEGYEYNALLGAAKVLQRKPTIDISIHPLYLQKFGYSDEMVKEILNKNGLKIRSSYGDTYFWA